YLAYFVGENTLFTILVTSNEIYVLKKEKPEKLATWVESLQSAIREVEPEDFTDASTSLYQILLQPIKHHLQGIEHLQIIRHDILNQIPFEVLLPPMESEFLAFHKMPYLLQQYSISYHYSATLLLKNAQQKTTDSSSNGKASFIGFAPVSFNGKIAPQLALSSRGGKTTILRSNPAGKTALQNLPDTETEVKEIYQLFQNKQLNAKAFLYASASKNNLIKEAPNHQFVLISTHGFVEEEGLSGIYLAEVSGGRSQGTGVAEQELEGKNLYRNTDIQTTSKPQETISNYLLTLAETYHLDLQKTDLVVLSSCGSGVGKLQKGEGMMAMNRGFLYAGAKNIIFTQFDVPDKSSSQLVRQLFAFVLEGEAYAKALQQAKLSLLQDASKSPRDWAGYCLIGA
ncbi:MAG: CHAT domain-containing protein, partial [Chitinophagales bacterium]